MTIAKSKLPIPADIRATRSGNLVNKIRFRFLPTQLLKAFCFGVIFSATFAPLEFAWLAWFGLIPIIHLGYSKNSRPWLLGYAFGFGHFVTTFAWLREVFILAPVGMAVACAVFPAFWLFISKTLVTNLQFSQTHDLLPRNDPSINVNPTLTPWKTIFAILAFSFIWCGTEWCRSWFLSGFPWNQLGISQWQHSVVFPLVRYTGVYGVSFLIMIVNMTIYFFYRAWFEGDKTEKRTPIIWISLPIVVSFSLMWFIRDDYNNLPQYKTLKIAAIQGNIPQSRQWSPDQLNLALEVYTSLTRRVVKETKPDLIVWPETAIPASLTHHQACLFEIQKLFRDIRTPMISGSITYQFPNDLDQTSEPPRTYNSALFFNSWGEVVESYDKIHLVPFGEFVPLEMYFPWLVDWIGMGRSLTAGREYTVTPFANTANIGVNICFEDVFPEISARMVRNGADLLLVITNDAWFGETSGSRQHLAHTIFRAVENFRPVLRNGNNSDTCLIMPDGKIENILYNSETGDRFIRKAGVYTVPISINPPITFYTRFENLFAILSFSITSVCALWCFYRFIDRKKRLYGLIRNEGTIE